MLNGLSKIMSITELELLVKPHVHMYMADFLVWRCECGDIVFDTFNNNYITIEEKK